MEGFDDFEGLPWRGRDAWPFGPGQWPFGSDGFDGLDGFPDGGRGFWFESEDGDRGSGIERRFCFGDNGEMSCFGDGEGLEELSEQQQQELEEWMESFRQFGPGRFPDDFFDDFLDDFLKDYLAGSDGRVA